MRAASRSTGPPGRGFAPVSTGQACPVADTARRRFRFSVLTTGGTDASRRAWADYARRVEGCGLAALYVADHFENRTVCTPRLAAAAAVTAMLRLGSYVYANDFRHPVLLAREAAEIDVLSDGRMELGLGAGWSKSEYEMVGIAFEPGPVRAERLEEAVSIIRRLHAGETVDHSGRHYRLSGCELLVEPVQHPIPLMLGGGGPRMTRLAARWADTVAFVPRSLPDGGLDPAQFATHAFEDKIAVLNDGLHLRPRPGPERAVMAFGVFDTFDEVPAEGWTSRRIAADSPYMLIGDTEQIIDTIIERRERWGISHWTFWEKDLDRVLPIVDRLAGR